MRANKSLTSRQIFRFAVPARTVTKKHCLQHSRPRMERCSVRCWQCPRSIRIRVYETVCRPSVCPSVRHIIRRLRAAATGLLLSAVSAGNIDRQRRLPGAQQQWRRSSARSSKCRQCRVVRRRKLNTDDLSCGGSDVNAAKELLQGCVVQKA